MKKQFITASEIEKARELWKIERSKYERYGKSVVKTIERAFSKSKIPISISFRAKEVDSLLKKMVKSKTSYDSLTDKVGARVTVHFKSDLNKAKEIILKTFGQRVVKDDDKSNNMDYRTFDYLSIHFDIVNTINRPSKVCELQLRTVCQNAWAELSHILTYKPGIEIPNEIRREVNALSALMEIADTQFEMILDKIEELPSHNPTRIINEISRYYYNEIFAWYDTEMSHYFLNEVIEIYDKNDDIIKILLKYIDEYGNDIVEISKRYKDIIFYTQPEIVLILERLDNNKELLIEYWTKKYPLEQLEDIAAAWGNPID